MRTIVVGLGIQGQKRKAVAGGDVVASVDLVLPGADYQDVREVPAHIYDAACVCVPDTAKLPLLKYLLEAGKHVLVEKPLLGPAGELSELEEQARRRGLACYTAYNHRFEPHITRVKQWLESQPVESIYYTRMFYGNGTAQNVRNSPWRDKGGGVIPDLGSHLLDLALFFFGPLPEKAALWSARTFENRAPDHAVFGLKSSVLVHFETSLLSWRNAFAIDIYGRHGSAHVQGLCKWGPSTLILRRRVLPSGVPEEKVEVLEQADSTWETEYGHFRNLCKAGGSNLQNDIWVSGKLSELMISQADAPHVPKETPAANHRA